MSFFFTKTENRSAEQVLSGGGGVHTSRNGKDVEKVYRRANMVQILCAHVFKWENETC
jgi:hypothetical protein